MAHKAQENNEVVLLESVTGVYFPTLTHSKCEALALFLFFIFLTITFFYFTFKDGCLEFCPPIYLSKAPSSLSGFAPYLLA